MKVLKKYKEGTKVMQIARDLNLSESTVRTIKQNEKKIRDCADVIFNTTATKIIRPRDSILHSMDL